MPGPFTTPVALSTPFEPNRNPQYNGNAGPSGLSSTEVQSAIEEARATAPGTASRFVVFGGFDGTATTGRWLEIVANVASNVSGFVIAEPSILKAISIATENNSTTSVGIYKNGVLLTTISLSAAQKGRVSGLNFSLAELDELSMKVESGSSGKPIVGLFVQTA